VVCASFAVIIQGQLKKLRSGLMVRLKRFSPAIGFDVQTLRAPREQAAAQSGDGCLPRGRAPSAIMAGSP